MMNIKQFDIYLINFNPARGTMSGKIRPAIIIQTDRLNNIGHSSSIVIPLSSQDYVNTSLLRIKMEPDKKNGLNKMSYIIIDQLTTVDNNKLLDKVGVVSTDLKISIQNALKVILDL